MKIVTIIDTGLSNEYIRDVIKNRVLRKISYAFDDKYENMILSEDTTDDVGHGTSVCSAINMINSTVRYNIIKICGQDFWADETAMCMALEHLYSLELPMDVLHISAGFHACIDTERLYSILYKFYEKGIVIVAAFSNLQVISYPAAFDFVLGVNFTNNIVGIDKWIMLENSPINILATGHPQNLVSKNGELVKTAGSSFAAAYITGHITKLLETNSSKEVRELLKEKAVYCTRLPDIQEQEKMFRARKIVIFPYNKENHSIVRNSDLLNAELVDVLDLRYSRNIGKIVCNMNIEVGQESQAWKVKDIFQYDWGNDFDTVVLGHVGYYQSVLKEDLYEYIYNHCIQYKKNLYSYDFIPDDIQKKFRDKGLYAYFPRIIRSNVLQGNNGMLYEISKPVVGVFGTSSQQGKWSLQLNIHRIMKKKGYRVCHLGTEPTGDLFEDTKACVTGYNAIVEEKEGEKIATFNYLCHKLEEQADLVLIGGQSGVIPYSFGGLSLYPQHSHELILACEPQASILCINEGDDVDFIGRCIMYLESFRNNKVIALAYFHREKREKWDTKKGLTFYEMQEGAEQLKKIQDKFSIKIYNMDSKTDMERLCDAIVDYF